MKEFFTAPFDPARCREELAAFQRLLEEKKELEE